MKHGKVIAFSPLIRGLLILWWFYSLVVFENHCFTCAQPSLCSLLWFCVYYSEVKIERSRVVRVCLKVICVRCDLVTVELSVVLPFILLQSFCRLLVVSEGETLFFVAAVMCSCSIVVRSERSCDGDVGLLLHWLLSCLREVWCCYSCGSSPKNCSCDFVLSASLLFAQKLEYLQCRHSSSRSNLLFTWQPTQLMFKVMSSAWVEVEMSRATISVHWWHMVHIPYTWSLISDWCAVVHTVIVIFIGVLKSTGLTSHRKSGYWKKNYKRIPDYRGLSMLRAV